MYFIIFILYLMFLYSCGCGCNCQKDLGCKILTAKQNTNDSIISTKIFCSQTNFATDSVLEDSVEIFYSQYQTDSTTVTYKDSIYLYQPRAKVDCDESDDLTKEGFNCNCFK